MPHFDITPIDFEDPDEIDDAPGWEDRMIDRLLTLARELEELQRECELLGIDPFEDLN